MTPQEPIATTSQNIWMESSIFHS